MKHSFLIPFLIGFFSCAKEEEPQEWQRLATYPGTQNWPAAVVHDDKAYLFFGNQSRDVWCYDAQTDQWNKRNSYRSDYPGQDLNRWQASAFVLNDMIYVVGGVGKRYVPTQSGITLRMGCLNEFLRYDPQHDTWETLDNFPGQPRRGGISVVCNNKAYYGLGDALASSGIQEPELDDGSGSRKDLWMFDPQDGWTSLPDFPGKLPAEYMPLRHPANPVHSKLICFVAGDEIMIVTGDYFMHAELWAFNTVSKQWQQKELIFEDAGTEQFFTARSGCMVLPFRNHIYVALGMWTNSTVKNPHVYRYDPVKNSWKTVGFFDFNQQVNNCTFAMTYNNAIVFGLDYDWSLNAYETWKYIPKN